MRAHDIILMILGVDTMGPLLGEMGLKTIVDPSSRHSCTEFKRGIVHMQGTGAGLACYFFLYCWGSVRPPARLPPYTRQHVHRVSLVSNMRDSAAIAEWHQDSPPPP